MNLGSLLEKAGVRKGQRMLGLFAKDRPKKCCPFPLCQGKEPSARGEGRDARWLKGWEGAETRRLYSRMGGFQKVLHWPCSLHMAGPGKGNLPDRMATQGLGRVLLGAGAGSTKSALCSQPAAVFKTYVVGLFFNNSEIIALTFTGVLSSENNFSVLSSLKKPQTTLTIT